MTTAEQTTHTAYANRIQSAHTALFKLIESHTGRLEHITYADAGISLQIAPGTSPRATVKPFCSADGRLIPGLELVVPDERTASYLLLDTVEAVKGGKLDIIIKSGTSAYAHIDKVDGYPSIIEWLQE